MEKTKPKFYVLLAFLFIIILYGCVSNSTYQIIQHWSSTAPKNPIIFQGDVQTSTEFFSIDSNKNLEQKIKLLGNFVRPVWSYDGNYIFGLMNPKWMFAYEEGGFPAIWDIRQEKLVACQRNLPHYWQIEEYKPGDDPNIVILQNIEGIYLFDMQTCKNKQILVDYSDRSSGLGIFGFSYFSGSNELVFGEKTSSTPYKYRIVKVNLADGKHIDLAEGINPSWSKDGSRIAFTSTDGIYTMQANGDQIIKVLDLNFSYSLNNANLDAFSSYPRFSPDGKWLIFHYCIEQICSISETPIYLLNINTEKNEKLFVGGMYPYWKP